MARNYWRDKQVKEGQKNCDSTCGKSNVKTAKSRAKWPSIVEVNTAKARAERQLGPKDEREYNQ
jgi:hypothetical protein